jgi:hypothetical protein
MQISVRNAEKGCLLGCSQGGNSGEYLLGHYMSGTSQMRRFGEHQNSAFMLQRNLSRIVCRADEGCILG